MKKITKQTLEIFWNHIKLYKWQFFGIIFSITIAIFLQILIPIYFRDFFNLLSIAGESNISQTATGLIHILIKILIIEAFAFTFFRLAGFNSINFQLKVSRDMLNSSFEYLHQHSQRFFVNKFVGALVRKVNRLVSAF